MARQGAAGPRSRKLLPLKPLASRKDSLSNGERRPEASRGAGRLAGGGWLPTRRQGGSPGETLEPEAREVPPPTVEMRKARVSSSSAPRGPLRATRGGSEGDTGRTRAGTRWASDAPAGSGRCRESADGGGAEPVSTIPVSTRPERIIGFRIMGCPPLRKPSGNDEGGSARRGGDHRRPQTPAVSSTVPHPCAPRPVVSGSPTRSPKSRIRATS